MILGALSERFLQEAVRRAAQPSEDVFAADADILSGLRFGFPRALIYSREEDSSHVQTASVARPELPRIPLTRPILLQWETAWQNSRRDDPVARVDDAATRLRTLIQLSSRSPRWADEVFRSLVSASGQTLSPAFKGFARRVLEFPRRYNDLHGISLLTGHTRDAVKARFRRRDIPSPSLYLRWLRSIAVAYALGETGATTAAVAYRFGYSSGGNLCRSIGGTVDMTTVELRTPIGRSKLLLRFTDQMLKPQYLQEWTDLGPLFLRGAA
jgi:hypothetical protein